MKRSGSQTFLLVISILCIIGAVLGFAMAGLMFTGGAIIGAADPQSVADVTSETGLTQAEVGGVAIFIGVMLVITSIVELLMGIFGVRGANDPAKIMPVWVFALIDLIFVIIGIIGALANGSFGAEWAYNIVNLVFSIIVFKVASNIKKQPAL